MFFIEYIYIYIYIYIYTNNNSRSIFTVILVGITIPTEGYTEYCGKNVMISAYLDPDIDITDTFIGQIYEQSESNNEISSPAFTYDSVNLPGLQCPIVTYLPQCMFSL